VVSPPPPTTTFNHFVLQVWVRALVVGRLQHALVDVADREVGNGVAGGLEEDHRLVASGDDAAAELDAHPPAERLQVEHALGHRGC
jgi:hypothetical protein